jgi:hypothetical protein
MNKQTKKDLLYASEQQQKIIVALFLLMGKALPKIGAIERNGLTVSESEILAAWQKKESPVRITSTFVFNERVFGCALEKLDMRAVRQVNKEFLTGKMPKGATGEELEIDHGEKKSRVFTLE